MDESVEKEIREVELERLRKQNRLLDLEIELQEVVVERERAALDQGLLNNEKNNDEIPSADEGRVSDEVRKCVRDGHNVTVLTAEALIVFEKSGRREQFAAVLDEITTYENEYKQYEDMAVPIVVDVCSGRLRSLIEEVMEKKVE